LVQQIHSRPHPIDVRPGNRPAIHASSLRVGRNVVVVEDIGDSVYETGWFGEGGGESVEAVLAAVYEVLPDDYDFVTVVLNWSVRGAFAFYLPLANDTLGLGLRNTAPFLDRFDMTQGRLQGFIMMNNWRFYGRSENPEVGRVVWLQEIGHRWGSFVHFDQGEGERDDLLGRDLAHWSYFMHTENSALEGNDWHENPDASFSTYTNARRTTYGQLDLYLMGVAGAETVPPFFLIDNPDPRGQRDSRGAQIGRSSPPEVGGEIRTIFGDKLAVSVDDIIAAEGPRNPGVENAQRIFRMATVYLVREGTDVSDEELAEVESLIDRWKEIFEEATQDQMNLIVNLDGEEPLESVGFGEACEHSAQCDNVTATVCIAVADDGRICSKRCFAHEECGTGFCCDDVPDAGDLFCYPRAEPCSTQDLAPDTGPAGDADAGGGDETRLDASPPINTAVTQADGCTCRVSDRTISPPAPTGRVRSLVFWPFSIFR
jgi:hypothetical protein